MIHSFYKLLNTKILKNNKDLEEKKETQEKPHEQEIDGTWGLEEAKEIQEEDPTDGKNGLIKKIINAET